MKDYRFLQQKYITPGYPNRGLTFVRGEGAYLIDENGDKYLDLMSNYGVNILGYGHPEVTKKLTSQLSQLTNLHGSFTNDIRATASQRFIQKCGNPYAQVYWANSGTEAIEAALKFAVLTTGKTNLIAAKGGYHGKTLGALSAMGTQKYREPFEPLLWHFKHVSYDDLESIERSINKEIAAVILEPIQGESGIIIPSADYLKKVRDLCAKNGVLLVLDEIQTGSGRTGAFLASSVQADILCLGKGLAAGMPIGATVVTKDIAQKIPKSIHTSTFGGNPLACAGAQAILDLLDDKMLQHVEDVGNYFLEQLKAIKSDKITEVRGKGLMIGFEISGGRNEILKRLQKEKILAIPAGDTVVRFLPPYIIEKKHVDEVVSVLKKVLNR